MSYESNLNGRISFALKKSGFENADAPSSRGIGKVVVVGRASIVVMMWMSVLLGRCRMYRGSIASRPSMIARLRSSASGITTAPSGFCGSHHVAHYRSVPPFGRCDVIQGGEFTADHAVAHNLGRALDDRAPAE